MEAEDHKKINDIMRKTTAICKELMEIQSDITAIQNSYEIGSKEYLELFDAYLLVVNAEMSRELVFEKLANLVTED